MRLFRKSAKGNSRVGGTGKTPPPKNRKRVAANQPNRRRVDKSAGDSNEGKSGEDKPRRSIRSLAKPAVAVAKLLLALAATGLTIWGGFAAYRHATTSDYFAVERIEVEGNKRLSQAEIMEAGQVSKGVNVFSLDVEAISSRLEEHPWIAEASAVRRIPDSIFVEVRERRPEMLVVFDVPYLVDDGGEIFKRWVPGDPTGLPILSGLDREQLHQDVEGVNEIVRSAIALARRYRASGLHRSAPLAEIHSEVAGGFSLTVGDDPFYVKFGKGPYRTKLKRLAKLLSKMHRDGEEPSMIFFDNEVRPDRVTVKVKGRKQGLSTQSVKVSRVN